MQLVSVITAYELFPVYDERFLDRIFTLSPYSMVRHAAIYISLYPEGALNAAEKNFGFEVFVAGLGGTGSVYNTQNESGWVCYKRGSFRDGDEIHYGFLRSIRKFAYDPM